MPRGGMCRDPFAGNNTLNGLDDSFMAALFKGELTVDQTIALRTIKMSYRDYTYFGLGKNGITPEKFLEAYFYLYRCRASDPTTWFPEDPVTRARYLDAINQTGVAPLSFTEVVAGCFDTHYSLTGLADRLPIESFLERLSIQRRKVLKDNEKRVFAYMEKYRNEEWRTLPAKQRKGKYSFPREGALHTLVAPQNSRELAKLYLFGRLQPVETPKNSKLTKGLKYKSFLF